MKKKKDVKIKRRLFSFGLVSILILFFGIYNIFNYYTNVVHLVNKKEKLSKYLTVLKEEEDDLKIQINKLSDSDYVARYAREKYLYSKDGEIIIVIP